MTRHLLGAAALTALVAAAPALAQDRAADRGQGRRVTIQPYLEASQVLDADLNNGGDVLTYTSVAAGVDAAVATRNTQGQVSARYERRFAYDRYTGDQDVVTGLARATTRLGNGLGLELGGLATRTREDIRGAAPALLVGNDANIAQVYSVYGGPTLSTYAGDVAVDAAYRAGYTSSRSAGYTGVVGQPSLDRFDHSFGQSANARASLAPGVVLPVGVTLSGGWQQDRAGQLRQHYDDVYGRGDLLLPVTPTLALAGGAGYEKLTVSQKLPLLTPAGAPVVDGQGRYVTDEASPRRIAFRTDGVYWDAGVVWRPNHRTTVAASAGLRYGSMSYTGRVDYQASQSVGLSIRGYDQVTTFGQQLRDTIAALPTSFIAARDAYSQQLNGCVFSANGSTPGGCLDGVFQSISSASYRARGVDGVLSATRGLSTYGLGAGYANRRLFVPFVPLGAVINGGEDQSAYAQAFWGRQLSRVSGIQANIFADWYNPASTTADIWSYGATASYYHNFGRLGTTATLGIYDFKQGDLRSQVSAQAVLAGRYTF